jgi:hypothetical protein
MSNSNAAEAGKPQGRDRGRREFYRRYDLLLANWYLLTGEIQQQVEAIRRDLHVDLGRWQRHLPEPDWSAYSLRLQAVARTAALH